MSDTPRTDAQCVLCNFGQTMVSDDFARTLERELTASRADTERLAECLRNVRPATLNCGTIDRQFWTGPSETTEIIDAALAEHEKDL